MERSLVVGEKRDCYEVLDISKSATQEEIKKAYKKKAMKFHPDRNPGDESAEMKFKESAEAYDVLGDEEKRRLYDQYGHAAFEGGGGGRHTFHNFEDIFSTFGDIFSDFSGLGSFFNGFSSTTRTSRGGPARGRNLKCEFDLTFEEAAFGTSKTIKLKRAEHCSTCKGTGASKGSERISCPYCNGSGMIRQSQGFFSMTTTCSQCGGQGSVVENPCNKCKGTGKEVKNVKIKIDIPEGIEDSTRLRVGEEGEIGDNGGPRGDLYCYIFIKEHPFFKRIGNDVVCEVPVSFSNAALGGHIIVPTLHGEHRLKIPPGTQTGKVFRMRKLGMKDIHGYGRGDQLVRINIEIPRKLNKRQKELLEEFSELEEHYNTSSEQKTFFQKMRRYFSEND